MRIEQKDNFYKGAALVPPVEDQKKINEEISAGLKELNPSNIHITTEGLSICIIVKDEIKNLPILLNSIKKLNAEICIVDTGSTDGTWEFLQTCELKTKQTTWKDDFAEARNVSLEMATKEYILWLDADDILSEKSVQNLKLFLTADLKDHLIYFNVVCADENGESMTFSQPRLFHNRKAVRFGGRVHESVEDACHALKYKFMHKDGIEIIHTGYNTKELRERKIARNFKLLLKEPDTVRTQMFIGMHYYAIHNYWFALGTFLHMLEKNPDMKTDLKERITFLIGLQVENLNIHEAAIEWYENSTEPDCAYRIGEIYDKKKNILECKKYYEKYLTQKVTKSKYGEYSRKYRPLALKRLQDITKVENEYWQNYIND